MAKWRWHRYETAILTKDDKGNLIWASWNKSEDYLYVGKDQYIVYWGYDEDKKNWGLRVLGGALRNTTYDISFSNTRGLNLVLKGSTQIFPDAHSWQKKVEPPAPPATVVAPEFPKFTLNEMDLRRGLRAGQYTKGEFEQTENTFHMGYYYADKHGDLQWVSIKDADRVACMTFVSKEALIALQAQAAKQ